jgi:hypothetical protein
MTSSAWCWWRVCHCVRCRTGTDTHTHTHTHAHTHIHVIPRTRYNYSGLSFPFVCPFLYFSPHFLSISSHLLFRKLILFFILFFLLFSFVSFSDLFRNSFQIPHFFSFVPFFLAFILYFLPLFPLSHLILFFSTFYLYPQPSLSVPNLALRHTTPSIQYKV